MMKCSAGFFSLVFGAAAALLLLRDGADAYAPMGMTTKRSTMSMKRGRGSFKDEVGGEGGPPSSFSSSSSSSSSGPSSGGMMPSGRNWYTVPNKKIKDLPAEEGKVGLLETQNIMLVNKQTNPAGTVSVLKYRGETHCFDVQCPQCKIPMTNAKPLPPNDETGNKAPRVACDFCKSTFNLKTGERLKSEESTGLFGGIAKAILGSQGSAPLAIYQLGEKDGKIMLSLK